MDFSLICTSAKEYRETGDRAFNQKNYIRAFDAYAKGEKDWGDVHCRYKLAHMYYDEQCVVLDIVDRHQQAIRLFKKNAKQGHRQSCHQLGLIYAYGYASVKRDTDEALQWFTKARLCVPDGELSCFIVGDMFQKGNGFEKDYESALQWYNYAILLGHIDSLYSVATLYEEGGFNIEQNRELAAKFYERAANEESCTLNAEACNMLGKMYKVGEGVNLDYEKAFYWFKEASTRAGPSQDGQFNLGNMFLEGLGVEADATLGQYWITLGLATSDDEEDYDDSDDN